MKLKNTTDWPDWFLRRMVAWCCRELGLPVRYLRQAQFGVRSDDGWRGCAWRATRRILVRIGRPGYPTRSKYTHQRGAVVFELHNREELLVNITAHELAHQEHYRSRRTLGGHEQCIDRRAFVVLEAFRANREALLAEWIVPPVVREKPKASIQDKRAAKAAADLARWQRKLKLAQTKCRKLKQRVAYYDKALAAARPQ